ncbi:peptidoglycan recognition protein 1-like [Macrosteles quadrilineatus]|uniref:peptidoglycan recognition protein 1-like n=1 Tax=Macrosteles quadrilineatus TaxID=74068 RepID=UPI0023E11DFB|nr:peptidoglycan recognition protein 1-like [Macrosteles quadrilineatus]
MTCYLGTESSKCDRKLLTVTYVQQPEEKDGPCKYSQVVGDEGMEMIPRWAWQAPPIPETPVLPTPATLVRITITGGQPCKTFDKCCKALKKIRTVTKRQKGIDDVPFNFMIGADGRVYEGRGWTLEPHRDMLFAPELMGNYLEFAFIGKYDSKHKEPWACRGTANMLLRYGVKMGFIHPEYHAEYDYQDKVFDYFRKPRKLNRWFRPHTTR